MKNVTKYQNKHVLVLGLGTSGVNAANLLLKLGAKVTVNDKQTPADLTVVTKLQAAGITVVTGSHPLELLDGVDLMVKNPGIPYTNVLVAAAVTQGIPVITEPELAYEVSEAPMYCVTGSNGKTTTTTMITLMLNQGRKNGRAVAVGNIGVSASKVAQEVTPADTLVTEISSFQLMGITDLHPHIAVLTNIYQAHTDWHQTHANYIKAKMRVTMNQTAEAREVANHTQAQVIPFSRQALTTNGAYEKDGVLYYQDEAIMPAAEIKVPGTHNVENALAAIAVAKLCGKSNHDIIEVLKTFSGVRHRTQFVTTVDERKVYNDSKATDIEATQKALDGFTAPVVLLAGGLDRGFTFDRLVPDLQKHVRAMVVLSQPGDIILLSPACASWDQWPTFEVRGDRFIEAVEQLKAQVEVAK